MSRTYNVIDADGHILEPFDLWNKYTDPKYRDQAPRLLEDENGKRRLIIEERALGDPQRGFGSIGGVAMPVTVCCSSRRPFTGRSAASQCLQRI
jgi:uncharacterized protein